MNVKLRVLSAGALFFLGQAAYAQQKPKDTTAGETAIEEVVVIGYSQVPKESYVGTASKVDAKSIDSKNVSTVSQALAGEAAGVRVINTSGQPGTDATIRIRGFGSMSGNRSPLYVLDGMPFTGNVSSINPEDIENMVILKDATATSIYGARGANGVVVINTKKGRSSKSVIQLESKVGFNMSLLPRYSRISSPEEYVGLSWQALRNQGRLAGNANPTAYANTRLFSTAGISPDYNIWGTPAANLIDPNTGMVRSGIGRIYDPENWEDYAFQTSARTENNLSISGGSGKTTYYTNIGYLSDKGYSINSNFERYNGRLNLTHQARPWLKGEFNLGYAYSKAKRNGQSSDSGSIFWFVDNIPSLYPLFTRDANGNKIPDPHFGGNQFDYGMGDYGRGFGGLTNAIGDATNNINNFYKHEINANMFLKADITKNLSFETRIGGQYYNNSNDQVDNPFYGNAASQNGYISKSKTELMAYNWLQLLRYQKRFGDHNVMAFAAHESNSWEQKYLSAGRPTIIDMIPELNQGVGESLSNSYTYNYTLESYFGQLTYDFQGKYFFNGTVRRDGTSRFLQNKWDTFWSAGFGWLVTKENFLNDNKTIKHLKLKASYGTVGDQSIVGSTAASAQNGGYYPGYNVYNPGNFMGLPAATYDRDGYPNLTWEKSNIFQVGAEIGLFKNRAVELEVDYYHRTTNDLIFDNRLAPSTGNGILKVNDGKLVNQGLEFTLKTHIINKDNMYLDFGINGEILRNKLTQMPIDPSTGVAKIIDLSEAGFGRAEGRSLYDFYMREYVGVNSATGAAQWSVSYVDTNGNGKFDAGEQIGSLYEFQKLNPNADIRTGVTEVYSQATQKFLDKSAIPAIRGAFNLDFGYKQFSLGVQFLYSLGGYAYDGLYAGLMGNGVVGNNNWHTDIRQRWQNPGDVTDVPRMSSNAAIDANQNARSSRFLVKSDYLALNNIRLGYNLPQDFVKAIGLTGFNLFVSGDNLWIATKRKGFNPSVSETGASSTYAYAPLSTITFGAKINF
ncbi:SusC/RagA family TonB-linked outer membrane protein [Chryseobacterium indologenes]|uniref:SusC/RagA family TonB-linked outer membrane protein n=2 Tax=Chryseobacterium indologenes TaxID=253 RepID=A0AAD1DWW1_CHRID|nr:MULTISPECIES: SusC/RagA family TonB-linked outer membrane protein [Chryseobacterium]ASE63590.1 SusC/RagA family TonB-linked outer membrane protein [Chryseobacterium indologenes]AYZ37495.1 SusC/RagA family TonB-linked outer membrane protein [Chryseobacterium indologenes]AZB19303.1 SusC/RagA family TonB-linked outer membrane protein [Chryseobacterium indologenes]MBF6646367.1 SusC/RagA family TonB-linked outer membrane protein [Chryseobacterium indologenes]MEB4761687.1 SusC/RagA family TonB-li